MEEKCPIISRISDASTIDQKLSSDEENFDNENLDSLILSLENHSELFTPLSDEIKNIYSDFQGKIIEVYSLLDKEIEPVNVRDEKTIGSSTIKLATVSFSRISQRRSTILNR